MSLTLDEFRRDRPRPAATQADPTRLRAIAQEGVRMAALTNDENWDFFLRYIEALIKAAERHLKGEMDKLANPLLVDDREIRLHKVMVATIQSRIETLGEVLLLPKVLRNSGAKAADIIAEIERDAA